MRIEYRLTIDRLGCVGNYRAKSIAHRTGAKLAAAEYKIERVVDNRRDGGDLTVLGTQRFAAPGRAE